LSDPILEQVGEPAARTALEQMRSLRQALPEPSGPLRAREPIRHLCAQIRSESRIAESLEAAPAQAGPLNAQGVVVRTLHRLQQLSPDYLERLMVQVDALSALEALLDKPAPVRRAR
jgi:hypothetical protein